MLEWLLNPILEFFSSSDDREGEKLNAMLRPYVGKKLWLAVAPDRSKVLFTALTPKLLQAKADALGLDTQDFISCRAPRKIIGGSE